MIRTIEGPDWYRHLVDRDVCKHCGINVIRFPQVSPERWLHDGNGFRIRACKGKQTHAEPSESNE